MPATVAYDDTTLTATLTPNAALTAGATYTARSTERSPQPTAPHSVTDVPGSSPCLGTAAAAHGHVDGTGRRRDLRAREPRAVIGDVLALDGSGDR